MDDRKVITIDSYYKNSMLFCKCDKKGMPEMRTSGMRRKHEISEVESEKKFINEIRMNNFKPNEAPINTWIMGIFNIKKTNHQLISSVAKFFSLLLQINLPREAYRRRMCCIYWLMKNVEQIFWACSVWELSCKTVDGKTYTFKSYNANPKVPNVRKNVVQRGEPAKKYFPLLLIPDNSTLTFSNAIPQLITNKPKDKESEI